MSMVCPPQLGYRDKAWSVNRLGSVARRHGYGEACTRIINSLYGFNAMEVQEAFVKIREQARPLSASSFPGALFLPDCCMQGPSSRPTYSPRIGNLSAAAVGWAAQSALASQGHAGDSRSYSRPAFEVSFCLAAPWLTMRHGIAAQAKAYLAQPGEQLHP